MAAPSDNLFVADFPAEIDQASVETILGAYGTIVSTKFLPGQEKHAALVRFQSLDEAKWIVENLNGNIPQGLSTPIQVVYARSGSKGAGGFAAGKGAGERFSPYGKGAAPPPLVGGKGKGEVRGKGGETGIKILKKGLQAAGSLPGGKWSNEVGALWIGGLPADTTDLDMYHIFAPFGCIPSNGVRAMLNEDGSCKGFGFVNYIDPQVCEIVIQALNGAQQPDGTLLQVKPKGPSTKGKEGGKDAGKGSGKAKGGKAGGWF
uniref:RRM domain-containing protein n=1 Tax=Alexandrium andersonii TaxID=327968 RepID=A0A7S2JCI8_9DINO